MKYIGSSTKTKSAIPYTYDNQLRCFSGPASSGQLSTRSMVVSQVFDFELAKRGAEGSVSSATEPKTCRRKGFHRESFIVFMVVDVLGTDACLRVVSRAEDAADSSRRANASLLHGFPHEAQP
jgi:hypothetical protein